MTDIDFETAMNQANRISEISEEIRNMSVRNFELAMKDLALRWESENCMKYQWKSARLENNILKTSKELESIAEEIKRSVKEAYEADID